MRSRASMRRAPACSGQPRQARRAGPPRQEGIVGTYAFDEEEKDAFRGLVANMRATSVGLLAAAGVNVLFLIFKQARHRAAALHIARHFGGAARGGRLNLTLAYCLTLIPTLYPALPYPNTNDNPDVLFHVFKQACGHAAALRIAARAAPALRHLPCHGRMDLPCLREMQGSAGKKGMKRTHRAGRLHAHAGGSDRCVESQLVHSAAHPSLPMGAGEAGHVSARLSH